jgi:hypothetical protein
MDNEPIVTIDPPRKNRIIRNIIIVIIIVVSFFTLDYLAKMLFGSQSRVKEKVSEADYKRAISKLKLPSHYVATSTVFKDPPALEIDLSSSLTVNYQSKTETNPMELEKYILDAGYCFEGLTENSPRSNYSFIEKIEKSDLYSFGGDFDEQGRYMFELTRQTELLSITPYWTLSKMEEYDGNFTNISGWGGLNANYKGPSWNVYDCRDKRHSLVTFEFNYISGKDVCLYEKNTGEYEPFPGTLEYAKKYMPPDDLDCYINIYYKDSGTDLIKQRIISKKNIGNEFQYTNPSKIYLRPPPHIAKEFTIIVK